MIPILLVAAPFMDVMNRIHYRLYASRMRQLKDSVTLKLFRPLSVRPQL